MARKRKRKNMDESGCRPLSPETAEALKRQHERFVAKFGRPPGPDDPLFFDPSANEPRRAIDEVLDQQLLEAMHKAGVRQEMIYAYQKTGRIVTDDNRKYLTKAQLKEWTDAVDEWRRAHAGE